MTTSHKLFTFIAAGFGSGWLPKAPGTWGTLASLIPAWFIVSHYSALYLLAAALPLTALGCFVCMRILPQLQAKDPGWIVIDEWAGQWLCLAVMAQWAAFSPYLLLLSFLMFRLFDIFKPWPISRLERAGPAWWSIMADDLGAGLLGAVSGLILWQGAGALF